MTMAHPSKRTAYTVTHHRHSGVLCPTTGICSFIHHSIIVIILFFSQSLHFHIIWFSSFVSSVCGKSRLSSQSVKESKHIKMTLSHCCPHKIFAAFY